MFEYRDPKQGNHHPLCIQATKDPTISALEDFQPALRLALEFPDDGARILEKLSLAIHEGSHEPESLLLSVNQSQLRLALQRLLNLPDLSKMVSSAHSLKESIAEVLPLIKAFAEDRHIAFGLLPSIIEPLLYKNFSDDSAELIQEVFGVIWKGIQREDSRENLKHICALSILDGFVDEAQSPPVAGYLKAVRLPPTNFFPESVATEFLLESIFNFNLRAKNGIPAELLDGAPHVLEAKVCEKILSGGSSLSKRKDPLKQVLAWFVSQAQSTKDELDRLSWQITNQNLALESNPNATQENRARSAPQEEDLIRDFFSISNRLTSAMRVLAGLFAHTEMSSTTQTKPLDVTIRSQLEFHLGQSMYSLMNCYTSFDKAPHFPSELIVNGLVRVNELFTLSFDHGEMEAFYRSLLPGAIEKALEVFDFASARTLREIAPTDTLNTSRRTGVDDYIDANQSFIIDKIFQLSLHTAKIIDGLTRSQEQSKTSKRTLIQEVGAPLKALETGRHFLTPNTLMSGDAGLVAGFSKLVGSLISHNQRNLRASDDYPSLVQDRYDGLHIVSRLLGRFPDRFARSIINHCRQELPGLHQLIDAYLLDTNVEFAQALEALGVDGNRRLSVSSVLPLYDHVLAANRLYGYANNEEDPLTIPIIQHLKKSIIPVEIGFKILRIEEDFKTPPQGLPHIMTGDLPLLCFVAGHSLTDGGRELRHKRLVAFYLDSMKNPRGIQASSPWLLIKAAEEYTLECEKVFKTNASPAQLSHDEVKTLFSYLLFPLRLNLTSVPLSAVSSYALALTRIFHTAPSKRVTDSESCLQIALELQQFSLATILKPGTTSDSLFVNSPTLLAFLKRLGISS